MIMITRRPERNAVRSHLALFLSPYSPSSSSYKLALAKAPSSGVGVWGGGGAGGKEPVA